MNKRFMEVRPMIWQVGGNPFWDRSVLSKGEQFAERRASSPGALLIRLRALHRRLWILNATFETFFARVEGASRRDDGRCRHAFGTDVPSRGAMMSGFAVRWRQARLQSRADRAEARAAVAIERAAATLALADAAVRHSTEARARADAAGPAPSCVLDRSRGSASPMAAGHTRPATRPPQEGMTDEEP